MQKAMSRFERITIRAAASKGRASISNLVPSWKSTLKQVRPLSFLSTVVGGMANGRKGPKGPKGLKVVTQTWETFLFGVRELVQVAELAPLGHDQISIPIDRAAVR